MKYALLFLGLIVGENCLAQKSETSVLYRDYPNKVELAGINNSGPVIIQSISNAKIESHQSANTFIVETGTDKTVVLTYSWKNNLNDLEMTRTVECVGPDGIIRTKKASWLVGPWSDEKDIRSIPYINCG